MGHTLVVVHGNHVKTPLRGLRKMLLRERTKIVAIDGFDVSPLLAIHRCGSGLHVTRGTGFDLDEAKHILVPSNEIDFSVMPRGTVIFAQPLRTRGGEDRNTRLLLHDDR